ncbi:MAG: transglutaminase domain-containing protein, partial [Candidatus Stahlbacteria bacterium]|nr:transglutaminase domain-containing protein [Candidatus Stahlbacteria bacterium]
MLVLFLISWVSWYGMYVKGEKVGYSQITMEESSTGYKVSELTHIKLSVMGMERVLKCVAQYNVTQEFELSSFTFDLESEAQKILMRGEVEKAQKSFGCTQEKPKLKLSIKTGGTSQTQSIELKDKLYPITILPMLVQKFATNKEIEIFDPSIQSVNTAKCKIIETQGDSIKIEVEVLGATSTMWVSKDGTLLSQQQPMGIVVQKETKEEALKEGNAVSEVMSLYGIKSNVMIPNPREVIFLRLLVKGEFIKSERQMRLGDTLLIQTIGPRIGKEIKEYLEPTPFIQCKDERIVKLANKIVGNIQDPYKKSREIAKWVAENVKDMPTVSIPSALDVLATLEGDCGEHTVLFVALARACGIPAQIVVGIVYVGDGFYYHAWAKIWAGKW